MSVSRALERLLARLRPDTPVDAGLAELGLMIDDDLEALVCRALAVSGSLARTDLAAFIAASPRPTALRSGLRAVGAAVRRLRKRGLVEGPDGGPFRLTEAIERATVSFPRLVGPDGVDPPSLDLPAALDALPRTRRRSRPDGPSFARVFGGDPAAYQRALDDLSPGGRALADWIGRRITASPLRVTVDYAMHRVDTLVGEALSTSIEPARAFEATWLAFVDDVGVLIDIDTLVAHDERRVELMRRWAWFAGCPVVNADGIEPPLISAAALARIDYRRVLADARALRVMQRSEAAGAELLEAERKRRAQAARSYASGRRE